MKIGVLAMQGAFLEHQKAFEKEGAVTVQVRTPKELSDIDGLVIPGGESTTMGKMLVRYGMLEPLRNMIAKGFPVFGTCAGLVLLSERIEGGIEGQQLLGLLNVKTCRNGYGRQVESFEAGVEMKNGLGSAPFHGVFIRAPIICETGPGVRELARYGGAPVAVRQKNILAVSFHPELTDDGRFHRYFIEMVKEKKEAAWLKPHT